MVKNEVRVYGLKHQKEKRSLDHFAGLDVSVKETSVCIVDETGKVVREVKVASEPEALLAVLKNPAYHFTRIGLEAGPLSQWLFSALAEAELPVVCVETRHMQAVLKAQINKTDRNDARGIAQMMRVGLYRPVHVKTLRSQKLRMLLTHRKLLQSKAIAIENDLRGTLRNFGLKVGMVGKVKFETRIKELLENLPDLAELVEPLLIVRRTLSEQIVILHRRLLAIVRDDEVCRRLMTIPGVGPVVDGTQCWEVGWHRVIREVAACDLRQPSSLLGNGLMHPLSQFLLDLPELCPHAITPGSSFEKEFAPSRFAADVGEPQEVEGLRLSEPAPGASVRRMATKLDQAALLRVERQRELLQPFAHRIPEAPGVRLVLKANDDVVGVAHDNHVARGLAPSPAFGPEVEGVVQIDVGKQR